MNWPIASNEIKSVILKNPNKQNSRPDGFPGKFYQMFGEELIPVPLKLFQKCA